MGLLYNRDRESSIAMYMGKDAVMQDKDLWPSADGEVYLYRASKGIPNHFEERGFHKVEECKQI